MTSAVVFITRGQSLHYVGQLSRESYLVCAVYIQFMWIEQLKYCRKPTAAAICCFHSKLESGAEIEQNQRVSLMFHINRLFHPLCPIAHASKGTWYDSFIILPIISPFIYLSHRIRPPPLRCLIGEHRPEVQQSLCQIQPADPSRPRSAACEDEQPAIPAD